jgi:surface antigen
MRSVLLALCLMASPAAALNEDLQCVPFARAVSGIEIRGDAHTWWNQAEGHYARGNQPKMGAVLAFKPYGKMQLGHVAAVRKIIDSRNILVSHANWSLIEGKRGHIEENVRVMDVSEAGDWSEVRVWFASLDDLGTTHWPVYGFIYPGKVRGEREVKLAVAGLTRDKASIAAMPAVWKAKATVPSRTALNFSNGFMADIDKAAAREVTAGITKQSWGTQRVTIKKTPSKPHDAIGNIIASMEH